MFESISSGNEVSSINVGKKVFEKGFKNVWECIIYDEPKISSTRQSTKLIFIKI